MISMISPRQSSEMPCVAASPIQAVDVIRDRGVARNLQQPHIHLQASPAPTTMKKELCRARGFEQLRGSNTSVPSQMSRQHNQHVHRFRPLDEPRGNLAKNSKPKFQIQSQVAKPRRGLSVHRVHTQITRFSFRNGQKSALIGVFSPRFSQQDLPTRNHTFVLT
ncbi:hypothetical protein BDN72DRAFT_566170 [Pluteus cervinus]|uniref:Uncharacterized protein n=1 Tax=Pluteus cervinus TaxID=181527 RepID=A0ACD3AWF8_9AGAR|nr:hypothetical protein BDN72DRAFT_566170 [Pluteus cervinus]